MNNVATFEIILQFVQMNTEGLFQAITSAFSSFQLTAQDIVEETFT